MPVDTTDDKAESRLKNLIQHCVRHGAGCAYCSSGTRCLVQFQERVKDVMEARRRFRQQEKHIQEFQLLLMFQDQGKTMQNNAADPGAGEAEVTSSESGENVGEAEQTSDEEEQLTSVKAAAEAEQTSNSDDGEQEVHECRTSDESIEPAPPPPKKQRTRPASARARFACRFLGLLVCKSALEALMGVSKHTVQRVKLGHRDLRRGPRAKGAWGISMIERKDCVYNDMVIFLLQMYSSCGEGLPNKLKFLRTDSGGIVIDAVKTASAAVRPMPSDSEDEDTEPYIVDDSSDEERLLHGSALWMTQQRSLDSVLRAGCAVGELPRRFLPPGKFIHLWWQYVQVARQCGKQVGSYRTFLRACNFMFEKQTGILAFRKASGDHAKCTACEMFKRELRTASDLVLRASIIQAGGFKHSMVCARANRRARAHNARTGVLAGTMLRAVQRYTLHDTRFTLCWALLYIT